MQKIVTHLWFDSQAEEAANFYVALFKNSKVLEIVRYPEAAAKMSGRPPGSVMTVRFQLDGQEFVALNGGPHFKFTEAVSLLVRCENQAEIDVLWDQLSAGGAPGPCGWLKDKYGLSWQIVPSGLEALMKSNDASKVERVMTAILQSKKLDVAALQKAFEQG